MRDTERGPGKRKRERVRRARPGRQTTRGATAGDERTATKGLAVLVNAVDLERILQKRSRHLGAEERHGSGCKREGFGTRRSAARVHEQLQRHY
jgi:hypothetical protein